MSQLSTQRDDVPEVFLARRARPDRLIHLIPDELARTVPEHPLFALANGEDMQDGFQTVSASLFANAISRTAWYLESLLGKAHGFPTIGYIGPHDIRYLLFMFAAIKAGYKMLFTSPRNNLESHLHVLEGSSCHVFLYASTTQVQDILSNRQMKAAVVPELAELLDETSVPVYPYTKSFQEAHMDPCLVLHTTGSTGLPKPITWKLGILSTYEAWRTIPTVNGYVPTTEVYQQARRAFSTMPLFHTSGLNSAITWSLLLGVTLVYGAPRVIPNALYADQMHEHAGVDATMGAPSIYEELARDPEALKRLHGMKYVVASGAPLSQAAGDLISEKTRIISNLGSTETANLQRLAPGIEDWAYFYWHPTHSGIEMRRFEDHENLFELFLVKDTPRLDRYQGIFSTFPSISEWSMGDLYSRHPDPAKSFLYKYRGRRDDVVVLSNGEKISPALMEATLMSSELVRGAMIVGKGQFQLGALIDLVHEPPSSIQARYELVQRLLPVVAEANQHAPAHGQLDEYHIIFADPERPLHYLGQGKIQRRKTNSLYEKDIEAMYAAADDVWEQTAVAAQASRDFVDQPAVDFSDRNDVETWLRRIIVEISGIAQIEDDTSFFELGMDSLQVLRITREIRLESTFSANQRVSMDSRKISPKAVYANNTLRRLMDFLWDSPDRSQRKREISPTQSSPREGEATDSGYQSGDLAEDPSSESPILQMEALLQKYVSRLPQPSDLQHAAGSPVKAGTAKMTVLLTGSTGSLGSYILEELYRNHHVARIICLDRSSNAAARHAETRPKRGLSTLDPGRVAFFRADLSKARLGLEESTYQRLLATVTHIIHNQWPVNFNWTLQTFEPYILGVSHLAQLALRSDHKAFLQFISSVSSVGRWDNSMGSPTAPEEPVFDFKAAASMGYGQSKLVAECLLSKAAEISGLRCAVCRVGIVAGPVERRLGLWNPHEYIPSIMISSAHMGVFPATFPSRNRVDWIPVDKLSKILLEILASASSVPVQLEKETAQLDTAPGAQVYHVVNPNTVSWDKGISPAVVSAFHTESTAIKAVPFAAWVELLRRSTEKYHTRTSGGREFSDDEMVKRNPATLLLDFYTESMAEELSSTNEPKSRMLTTLNSERASETLRYLGPVKQEWLENWMLQWGIKSSWMKLLP